MPEKSYFNIIKMSEAFRKWDTETKNPLENESEFKINLSVWQVRAEMAIAQQLTMISQHLGELLEEVRNAKK